MPSSLTRFLSRALVYLYPPTCVGFGTDPDRIPRGFSCRRGVSGLGPFNGALGPRQGLTARGFTCAPPPPRPGHVHLCPRLAFRAPLQSNSCPELGNIDPMSIAYALRPRLRFRLTPGGRTCPGNPWDSGDRDSHPVFRYSCPHNHWYPVHRRFRVRLQPWIPRSPTSSRSANSAHGLTPDHFRRGISRPVSCYALFKWWLPLSQHPGCHRNPTSLVT